MTNLKIILQNDFNKYFCLSCRLSWFLAKDFTAQRCPFRGCGDFIFCKNDEDPIINLEIKRPEEVSLDELSSIFSNLE